MLVKVLEKDLRTVRKVWRRKERKEGVGAEKGPFHFDSKEGLRRQNKGRDWKEGKQKKQGLGWGQRALCGLTGYALSSTT